MPAFDPTGPPMAGQEEPPQRVQTEETIEEQKQKEEMHKYADERLKQLSPNDDVYFAIEYYLLGDPKRQIEQLGDVEGILKQGDEAKQHQDTTKARYSYETAAKIELYRRRKDNLRKLLILAQDVTPSDEKHFQYQRTMLDNIDEALRIAKDYYASVPDDPET
jgi:hypothetical protein